MPPMPPPPMAIAGLSSGSSLTAASVVISRPATEAASCSAVRTTLVGSMTPALTRSSYWSVAALKPNEAEPSLTFATTIEPSVPALPAI